MKFERNLKTERGIIMKRLTKSPNNRVISGVCGGLGEYLGLDPTVVRIAWVLFVFFGGSGIVVYILCALFMPESSERFNEVPYKEDDDRRN